MTYAHAVRTSLTTILILTSLYHSHPVYADAPFIDVKRNNRWDLSGRQGDPVEKYFHESKFHPHYDGRFAARVLPESSRLAHLTALIQTFLCTMTDLGIETWIMHGTLLGWWWNRKILPWDSDLDVQMSYESITFLAKYYNMTEYYFAAPAPQEPRIYLLELNPHYGNSSVLDELNVIDGRWIDTATGLFIDISTVRATHEAREPGSPAALACKDKHRYLERDIFPLRTSTFEGMPVKIPYDYVSLLQEEYNKYALVLPDFERHRWHAEEKLWIPLPRSQGGSPPKFGVGRWPDTPPKFVLPPLKEPVLDSA